jgi:hypothetical protein
MKVHAVVSMDLVATAHTFAAVFCRMFMQGNGELLGAV